jgi:hypothetical protein
LALQKQRKRFLFYSTVTGLKPKEFGSEKGENTAMDMESLKRQHRDVLTLAKYILEQIFSALSGRIGR